MGKIYTKTGDQGTTSLGGKQRVDKDDIRVETFGALDELNSLLGIIRSQLSKDQDIQEQVLHIQATLLDISAVLANPALTSDNLILEIESLEKWIDRIQSVLPEQRHFVIPGGTALASVIQFTRTVCRRTERVVVALNREEKIQPEILQYLNRLSDLLYVTALFVNYQNQEAEVFWIKK